MTTTRMGLGALMLLAGTIAMADHYKVREGDTISGIAHKFHIRQRALLDANDLSDGDHLRVGRRLVIPGSSSHSSHSTESSGSSHIYVVRNGDNDWAIAHRFDISEKALHSMNPDVDWDALQPGTRLSLPGGASSHSGGSDDSKPVHARGKYKVEEGDNDWTISSKLGVTNRALRAVNPDIRWTALQIGQKLNVPSTSSESSSSSDGTTTLAVHKVIHTRHVVINADNVTLRRGPSTDEDKVTTVPAGTLARVLDRDHGWYQLRFPKGTEAWVRGDFLNPVKHYHATYASNDDTPRHSRRRRHRSHYSEGDYVAMASPKTGSHLLDTAYSKLGARYTTGGESRSSGFDCSGFVQSTFRENGVHLPRTAHEQSGVGKRVDISHLKKGDLVFFKTNRGIRINHVGMYIGNGKFIHASSGGGHVQISSLSEGYYARRFALARRVLSDKKTKSKHKSHKG